MSVVAARPYGALSIETSIDCTCRYLCSYARFEKKSCGSSRAHWAAQSSHPTKKVFAASILADTSRSRVSDLTSKARDSYPTPVPASGRDSEVCLFTSAINWQEMISWLRIGMGHGVVKLSVHTFEVSWSLPYSTDSVLIPGEFLPQMAHCIWSVVSNGRCPGSIL